MNKLFTKTKEFFIKNEQKIVLIVAFCLIAAISFEFGVLQGKKWQQKPLIIEKPINMPEGQENSNQADSNASGSVLRGNGSVLGVNKTSSPTTQNLTPQTSSCAYVGSKNSNKFYVPTCSYAKRVKPENLVCYTSEEEALKKGKVKSDCK